MPTLQAAHLLTAPFRRHKQRYVINPPDELHSVVYLGNVLTIMAKGEQSIERPMSAIWRSYSQRKRDVPMKLTVTRSGLKVETKQLGITEYWAHRITFCYAPIEYPRVFCWVYKHEGKRMKPELRCHAVLCKKATEPQRIVQTLTAYLQSALQEYKREKVTIQKSRLSGGCPRRKLILQTGTLNFRTPPNRSKSAPRLGSIEEEDDEGTASDFDDFDFRQTPVDRLSFASDSSSPLRRQFSMRRRFSRADDPIEEDELISCTSSDDGFASSCQSTESKPTADDEDEIQRIFAANLQVTAL
ncbi:PID domain-containing protein [Aphelenchoides besseyi]|nr:PID domain-containing protein [Aphelenchoides besseyi]